MCVRARMASPYRVRFSDCRCGYVRYTQPKNLVDAAMLRCGTHIIQTEVMHQFNYELVVLSACVGNRIE